MLITIYDASKIFKIHETTLRSKIDRKELQPRDIQAKAKEEGASGPNEIKIKLYDYDDLKALANFNQSL